MEFQVAPGPHAEFGDLSLGGGLGGFIERLRIFDFNEELDVVCGYFEDIFSGIASQLNVVPVAGDHAKTFIVVDVGEFEPEDILVPLCGFSNISDLIDWRKRLDSRHGSHWFVRGKGVVVSPRFSYLGPARG